MWNFAKTAHRASRFGVALLGAMVLAACQTQPVVQERSVLLQRMDQLIQAAQPSLDLRLLTSPDPIMTGQKLSMEVATQQPGYLYVYQVATDGRELTLLFPNAVDGANHVQPGVTHLPRASWSMKATGPAGVGYLAAVLTQQPLDLLQLQASVAHGSFGLNQPYGAAVVPLRELAAY